MHDPCAPIALAVHEPSELQRAGIDGAIELWRAHGVRTISVVAVRADGAGAAGAAGADGSGEPARGSGGAIELRFEPAAGPFFGLYDDETGVVYVNRTIGDPAVVSIVLAHELGHAFGLLHVERSERRSLMNPGNIATPPTDADQAAVEALWGRCEESPPEPR